MVFINYWKNIFNWNGLESREQYLLPTLLYGGLYGVIYIMTSQTASNELSAGNMFSVCIGLLIFIAQLSLSARRLQTISRSKSWLWLFIFPVIGNVLIFILCILPPKVKED